MNIAVFAYGSIGLSLVEFVVSQKRPIVFICVKKEDPYNKVIKTICTNYNISTLEVDNINDKIVEKSLNRQKIDLGFLLWWPDIVKEKTIKIVKKGFVNLHPSFLPFNRGMHPYYWSIVENTPAGVSIHFIDKNIDAGGIICQKIINTDITTTGEKLYEEAKKEIIHLFKENFHSIVDNKINVEKVKIADGTFHLKKELDEHSCIDLNKTYKAIDLINIIRARSFAKSDSSFFYHEGTKYCINIEIDKKE